MPVSPGAVCHITIIKSNQLTCRITNCRFDVGCEDEKEIIFNAGGSLVDREFYYVDSRGAHRPLDAG